MTSAFRLIVALCIASLAFLAGLSTDSRSQSANLDREARSLPELDMWNDDEVDAMVERIVEAGLFPDAVIDTDSGANGESGEVQIGEVEAAFVDPSLRAFINTSGEWHLLIRRNDEESRTLAPGDMLADDWQVTSISATSVTFERGDERRTLDAYPSREG